MRNAVELVVHYRSFIGIVCLLAVLFLATPTPVSIFCGFFLILVGMSLRGWAAGYINKDQSLATDGPYSLTRNPLYFANFILGCGIALAGNNLYGYLVFLVYYLTFFSFLIALESKRLRTKFGKEYDEWSKTSNLFFPKIKKIDRFNFNISYYMRNKEYRVLFFSLCVVAILIVKYLMRIHA